jgi:uncharacterized protein
VSTRARHPVRGLLVILGVIVVLFHVTGGWYFSGRIESDALAVRAVPLARDLTVTHVEGDRIALADPGPQNFVLRSRSVYGVVWPGGYGRVSGPPSVSGVDVSRTWRLLDGTAPSPGTKVSLDGFAYPLKPLAGARLVHYPSPRGDMPATYFPGSGSTWAVLVHGKGATRAEMYRLAAITHRLGMPTLAIGYRNDADAPRDHSQRHTFGVTEWHDLERAVRYAKQRGASDIVLGGASMGGSIVASYLRNSADADQVQSVVLDAPMLNLRDTIAYGARDVRVPPGLPLPSTLTWSAEELASLRYGVDWRATDYISDPDWVRGPVLILHGTRDDTVPVATSEELSHKSGDVTLREVRGAHHVESWNVDPEAYDQTVTDFLERTTG